MKLKLSILMLFIVYAIPAFATLEQEIIAKQQAAEILRIRKSLEVKDRRSDHPATQYVIADQLEKLGDLTKEKQYHEDSVNSFKRAAELAPRSIYFAKLGNVYSKLAEFQKAALAMEISFRLNHLEESATYRGYVSQLLNKLVQRDEIWNAMLELSQWGEVQEDKTAELNLSVDQPRKISSEFFKAMDKARNLLLQQNAAAKD